MIPVMSVQLREFLVSGLLGLGLGLVYDLFRALRRKRRKWTPWLDFLFALLVFLLMMALAVYTRGLKLYQCLGLFLGASLYFLSVSSLLLHLLEEFLSRLGHIRRYLLGHLKKSVYFLRKLEKKFFSTWKKWSTINALSFFRRRPAHAGRHKASKGAADGGSADFRGTESL